MRPTLQNVWESAKYEGLFGLIKGLFTGRVRYLFNYKRAHLSVTGKPKIGYKTPDTAHKSNDALHRSVGAPLYDVYRCVWCDRWHIGKIVDSE